MINWIVNQQLILSILWLGLLFIERKALFNVGAKSLYRIWAIIPIALLANNLPQKVLTLSDNAMYHYVIKLGATSQEFDVSLSWFTVWVAGCLAVVVWVGYSQWQISKLALEYIEPASLPLQTPAGLWVAKSQEISSPILSGIFQPVLLIPENFSTHYSPRQQQMMLAHELTHLRRHDNLFNLVAIALVALFWFNPLCWPAYFAFRRSQEMSCDVAVLHSATKQDKINYGKALLSCAQSTHKHYLICSPYGDKHSMQQRIQNLQFLSTAKPVYIAVIVALSSLFVTGISLAKMADTSHSVEAPYSATPVKRVAPIYPDIAAKKAIEGAVVLQFDIDKSGQTNNIVVVKSHPEGVFDKASVIALKQWEFKPRIQGGIAQHQTGLKVQLDFKLDASE